MSHFIDAELTKPSIVQPPADIVMATQIIQEYIVLRQTVDDIHLLTQQTGISRCYRVPGGCHRCYIIQHMTFRFFYRAKIRYYFFRFHDNFSEKQYTRTHDLTDHTHHTNNIMYLRKISAIGSQLFPDIRNRIDTDHVDTFIGQIQHIIDHFVHNNRIPVIQIPLIWIEGGHYKFFHIIQPGKVTRCGCREYLRNRLFKLRRYIIIIIEIISIHVFPLSGSGSFCPLMFF